MVWAWLMAMAMAMAMAIGQGVAEPAPVTDVDRILENARGAVMRAAVKSSDLGRLSRALEDKPELVNHRDLRGWTPLHHAVGAGSVEVIERLLDAGADPLAKNGDGLHPAELAEQTGSIALALRLRQAASDARSRLEPERLGRAGLPENLSFEGLRDFPSAALKHGLAHSKAYRLASLPQMPVSRFLPVLEGLIRQGYQQVGYPDVRVQARFDSAQGRTVVQLDEGTYYRCGEIVILDAGGLSEDLLEAAVRGHLFLGSMAMLGLKHGVDRNSPSAGREIVNRVFESEERETEVGSLFLARGWDPDKPARFDAAWLADATMLVTNAIFELGYVAPRVDVRLRRRSAPESRADLEVEVVNAGYEATIASVRVDGAERNTRESILDLCGVSPGMRLRHGLAAEIEGRLVQCARFLTTDVVLEPLQPLGAHRLTIRIREIDELPLVTEAFSEEQRAIVGMVEWLREWNSRGDLDAMIEMNYEPPAAGGGPRRPFAIRAVYSPHHGLLSQIWRHDTPRTGPADYALLLGADASGLFALGQEAKWVVPSLEVDGEFRPVGFLELSLMPVEHPDIDKLFEGNFLTGLGFGGSKQSNPPGPTDPRLRSAPGQFPRSFAGGSGDKPFEFRMNMISAGLAHGLLAKDVSVDRQEQTVTVQSRDFETDRGHRLIMNLETGQPIEIIDDRHLFPGLHMVIRFRPNGFVDAISRLGERARGHKNLADPDRPGTSLAAFAGTLAGDVGGDDGVLFERGVDLLFQFIPNLKSDRVREIALQLMPMVASYFAEFVASEVQTGPGELAPPLEDTPIAHSLRFSGSKDSQQLAMDFMLVQMLDRLEEWVPEGSWIGMVARQTLLMKLDRGGGHQEEFTRVLESREWGPLAHLAAAFVLGKNGSPMTRTIAARGLQRLSREDFRRDCDALLGTPSMLREGVLKGVAELQAIVGEGPEVLLALLPEFESQLLKRLLAVESPRSEPGASNELVLALESYWQEALRVHVERALKYLAPGVVEETDPEAQFRLSRQYLRGVNTPANPGRALEWLQKAAQQGHAEAQAELGAMYFRGGAAGQDPAQGLEWLLKSAQGGSAHGAVLMGRAYATGTGVEADPFAAGRWFRQAAESGDPSGQTLYAGWLLTGPLGHRDPEAALSYYELAAEQTSVEGAYFVGLMSLQGLGMERPDPDRAFQRLKEAAERGHAAAQMAVSQLYATGQGVEVSLKFAYGYAALAAGQGHGQAADEVRALEQRMNPKEVAAGRRFARDESRKRADFYNRLQSLTQPFRPIHLETVRQEIVNLGRRPDLDESSDLDPGKAPSLGGETQAGLGPDARLGWDGPAESLPRAVQGLEPLAQLKMGVGFVRQGDYEQAVPWLHAAARQGLPAAQFALGVSYFGGKGVPEHLEDLPQAVFWFRRAAEQGHADSQLQLGVAYLKGRGVTRDVRMGFDWTLKAAEQGKAAAVKMTAIGYQLGSGAPTDLDAAMVWWRRLADLGDYEGLWRIGDIHWMEGRIEEAVDAYRGYVSEGGVAVEAKVLNHIAWRYVQKNVAVADAVQLIERSLKRHSRHRGALDLLGWACYLNGDRERGLTQLETFFLVDPEAGRDWTTPKRLVETGEMPPDFGAFCSELARRLPDHADVQRQLKAAIQAFESAPSKSTP